MAGRSTSPRRRAGRPAARRAARNPARRAAPATARAKARPGTRPKPPTPARKRSARPAAAPARVPNAIGAVMQHMDYSSHDVHQIRRFYTEILGFERSRFDEKHSYLWVQTGPSSSLGFMPPLPGPPEQWRPPREPSIHLIVEDVDRAHRLLTARGVSFEQAPTDMAWGYRTAVLRDPEGRLVCLAQSIRPTAARRPSR